MYLLQDYITAQFGSFNFSNCQVKEDKMKNGTFLHDVTKVKATQIIYYFNNYSI